MITPTFINIILYAIYVLLALAVVATIWATVRSLRRQGEKTDMNGKLPSRRIAVGTAVLLAIVMAAAWLLARNTPITANGTTYDSSFWLRTADMMIGTTAVLLVAITGLMVFLAIKNMLQSRGE
ncbi:MAG: hypothetical protein IJT98_07365 [Prevotella sp.]|nr:hypothetical protein [Prevotella sp.]